jgi:beta-phosphoglucomutase
MNKEIAVIFDMDGVICHTNPYHSLAFQEFFSTRNVSPTEDEFAEHMYGKSNSYILSHFLKRPVHGEELLELEQEKEGLFREIYEPHVTPISGIVPFMDNLKSYGTKLGVATSAPYANLDLILSKVPIRSKLSSILASEDVKNYKPDPEVYLKSAQNLGMQPEQCIVFEDSYAGVTAALNAGMKVVAVLTSHSREELPPCSLYIENYEDLCYQDLIPLL